MAIGLKIRLQPLASLFLVTCILTCTTATSFAGTVTILPSEEIINIGSDVDYLSVPADSINLQQFRSAEYQSKLKPTEMSTPSFGYTSDTYWFQTQLVHNGNREMARTLVVSYPLLDKINVYVVRQQGHVKIFEAGDKKPFVERPELHRHFTFPIEFQPRETVTLVIEAASTSSMQIPMELWLPEKLHHDDKEALLAQGIYYGIMIIMVIYNLFIFFII